MFDFLNEVDVDGITAITIAAGMKKMAMADGEMHPAELEMIESFLKEVKAESGESGEDLGSLNTPELQETFLKSLALVALVDGVIRDQEVQLLNNYVQELGFSRSAEAVFEEVGKSLLAQFRGVSAFRTQAEEVGRSLGLSDAAIAEALEV